MKLLIYRINNNYYRAITDVGFRLRILLIEDLIVQRVKNGKLNRRATEPLDRSGIDSIQWMLLRTVFFIPLLVKNVKQNLMQVSYR